MQSEALAEHTRTWQSPPTGAVALRRLARPGSLKLTPRQLASSTPVVVFVHGATLNGQMWRPVSRQLDRGLSVLTPDLPGHGVRRSERFTLAAAVDTVVAAVRSVAPQPVVLVGDALGGYVAMAAAGEIPDLQLKGLVLAGCSANLQGVSHMASLMKAVVVEGIAALFGEQRVVEGPVARRLVRWGMREDDVLSLMSAGIEVNGHADTLAALRGVDFKRLLAAIRQPVLMANGELDALPVSQESEFLAVTRLGSQHRFTGCANAVSLRRSDEFGALVNAFAQRVVASPPRSQQHA